MKQNKTELKSEEYDVISNTKRIKALEENK